MLSSALNRRWGRVGGHAVVSSCPGKRALAARTSRLFAGRRSRPRRDVAPMNRCGQVRGWRLLLVQRRLAEASARVSLPWGTARPRVARHGLASSCFITEALRRSLPWVGWHRPRFRASRPAQCPEERRECGLTGVSSFRASLVEPPLCHPVDKSPYGPERGGGRVFPPVGWSRALTAIWGPCRGCPGRRSR